MQTMGVEVRACSLCFDADEVGNTIVVVALVLLPGHIIERLVGVTEQRSVSCVVEAAGALSGVEFNRTSVRRPVDVAASIEGATELGVDMARNISSAVADELAAADAWKSLVRTTLLGRRRGAVNAESTTAGTWVDVESTAAVAELLLEGTAEAGASSSSWRSSAARAAAHSAYGVSS
jgi:hypothetical protein